MIVPPSNAVDGRVRPHFLDNWPKDTMHKLLALTILALLLFGCSRETKQERIDAAKAQITSLKNAAELYLSDTGGYPNELGDLRAPPTQNANPAKWKGPYLKQEIPLDPWGKPYWLKRIGFGQVKIASNGPDRKPDTPDDIAHSTHPHNIHAK